MAVLSSGCGSLELIVVYDKHKQGFTKTVNRGILEASLVSDICILNDDVFEFQYGWLEILRRVLYSNPRYGLSGPSGACGAAPMNKGIPGQFGIQVVNQISFWCVLLKREMIDQIGILDEAFIHYCSDNWYCHTMRKHKWQCVWAKAVFLKHHKHKSGIQSKWKNLDRTEYFRRLRK
jgi:GT2 family glycosyltransferase